MGQSETFTPININALGWSGFNSTLTFASGLDLAKGTVVAIVTATGLAVAYDDDGTDDGRRTAVGILLADLDTTTATGMGQAWPAPVCLGFGAFITAALTGMDANGLADLGGREVAGGFTLITGAAYSLAGLASITGNLTVSGSVTAADLAATDDLTVGDDAAITGLLTVGETLGVTGLTTLTGGLKMAETTGTDTAFAITASHNVVRCADFTSARTYTLPAAATYGVGRFLLVKAPSNANTYNLTLDGDASETIDGAATKVISTAYGAVLLQAITGGWAVYSGS